MRNKKDNILKNIPLFEDLKNDFPEMRALFFDMDGTLFNTEPHHAKAFIKIGQDFKIIPPHSPEEVHQLLVGRADHLVYEVVKAWPGFPKEWTSNDFIQIKNQHLLKILEESHKDDFFPSKLNNLLREAKKNQICLALVTSSEKVITHKLLELANAHHFFDILITRDDCPKHKPDPWPYIKAMELASIKPSEIVIFEDSEVGLTAAKSSGAHVIKVEWH